MEGQSTENSVAGGRNSEEEIIPSRFSPHLPQFTNGSNNGSLPYGPDCRSRCPQGDKADLTSQTNLICISNRLQFSAWSQEAVKLSRSLAYLLPSLPCVLPQLQVLIDDAVPTIPAQACGFQCSISSISYQRQTASHNLAVCFILISTPEALSNLPILSHRSTT